MQFSLKKLEKYISGVLPHYCSSKIVPRSLPLYVDKILSGEVRFSVKCGNNISTFEPDVTSVLEEDAVVLQSSLKLKSVSRWFVPGSIVYFGLDYETCIIEDVLYDQNIVIIKDGVISQHFAGSSLILQAVPVTVEQNSLYGSKQIFVDNSYFFCTGDIVIIEQSYGLFSSSTSYNVVESTYDQVNSRYILDLDKSINRNIFSGDTIYLKANPAYSSNIVLIPTGYYSVNRNGPCLVDYLSGRLGEGDDIDESFSMQIFDQFGYPIYGSLSTPSIISKNSVIQSSNIRSDALLFWDLIQGSLQYNKNETAILLPNLNGKFSLFKDLVPEIPSGQEWEVPVISNKDVCLMFKFKSFTGEDPVFLNVNLINFSYSLATGKINYSNYVNLNNVNIGDTFVDSNCREYLISGVDEFSYTLQLDANLDVSTVSPISSLHGSVRTGNRRMSFDLSSNMTKYVTIGTKNIETSYDRIEISYFPMCVFKNYDLIGFSYDANSGLLNYSSYVDLSSVEVGQYFLDSVGDNFKIKGKNESTSTLQLDTNLNLYCEAVNRFEQGSIIIDYSGIKVEMGEWYSKSPNAFSLSYNIVANTSSNWMSTGLILKNMFHSIDDISSKYDSHQKFNGGSVKL